ncbi:MAG: HAD domain-containing protein [Rhodospirillales bacterium]|jgi:hypothetical protein|nr:HAD domain-containing protein [Rhodospirillales bacterium]
MPRAILLDIDDVISSDRTILACDEFDEDTHPGYQVPRIGDHTAIGLINRVCAICAAKIVVSSSWLDVAGPAYTLNWLSANGLRSEHLMSPNPCVNYRLSGTKREAIEDWLVQNCGFSADQIVVIDDDVTLFPPDHRLADRQVVVDGEDGLLLRHYRLVLTKFGATDRAAGVSGGLRFGPIDE